MKTYIWMFLISTIFLQNGLASSPESADECFFPPNFYGDENSQSATTIEELDLREQLQYTQRLNLLLEGKMKEDQQKFETSLKEAEGRIRSAASSAALFHSENMKLRNKILALQKKERLTKEMLVVRKAEYEEMQSLLIIANLRILSLMEDKEDLERSSSENQKEPYNSTANNGDGFGLLKKSPTFDSLVFLMDEEDD